MQSLLLRAAIQVVLTTRQPCCMLLPCLRLSRPFTCKSNNNNISYITNLPSFIERTQRFAHSTSVKTASQKILKNDDIKSTYIYHISETGENLGVRSLKDVLASLDRKIYSLVQVATRSYTPNTSDVETTLPVCKVILRKAQYEKAKAKSEKKPQLTEKEVQIGASATAHDFEVKRKKVYELLDSGYKVNVTIVHKGAQARARNKNEVLREIIEFCQPVIASIKQPPTAEGKDASIVLLGKKHDLPRKSTQEKQSLSDVGK